jgi:hypothetical protein
MAANSTEQRKGKTNGEHGINYTQGANQTTFKCSDISLILWSRNCLSAATALSPFDLFSIKLVTILFIETYSNCTH